MAEIIQVSEKSPIRFGSSPDFSRFSIKPISWSLSLSNTHKSEDRMTIVFGNIPTYDGDSILQHMPITLDFNNRPIYMIVKSITYQIGSTGRVTTEILLSTQTFYFDTYISGGLHMKIKDISAEEAIYALTREAAISLLFDIDEKIKLGVETLTINGRQTILDYISSILNPKGLPPRYNWWVDIFNVFHIQKVTGNEKEVFVLDYKNIKEYTILNLINKLGTNTEEKEVAVAHNLNLPGGGKKKKEFYEMTVSVDGATLSGRKIHRRGVAGARENVDLTPGSLKNITILNERVSIQMKGLFFSALPGSIFIFKNFPVPITNDKKHVLIGITINASGDDFVTALSFETFNEVKDADYKAIKIQQNSSSEGKPAGKIEVEKNSAGDFNAKMIEAE